MRILKHGNKPEPKTLRFECTQCGCVFEETDDQCRKTFYTSFGGKTEIATWSVECPECENMVTKYHSHDDL